MQKGANPFTSPEMQKYFSTLAPIVQESILQSGVQFNSVDELSKFARQVYSSGE